MSFRPASTDTTPMVLPGLGDLRYAVGTDLQEHVHGGAGLWTVGHDGVRAILSTRDGKCEFIGFENKTIAYIRSSMGHPAMYEVKETPFQAPALAVLMDLDGTSVHSETFWMWVIEQVVARLRDDPGFRLEPEDEPYVSGHALSEHLNYCIAKYCPDRKVEEAREIYYEVTRHEMKEILEGRGHAEAFRPSPGLREFLLALKDRGIRIGLVTAGLYEKAWPEIVAAFTTLDLGDPAEFYDCIITAGQPLNSGLPGTVNELAVKPHPWLYAECARVGLGIEPDQRHRVIGIEDSGAGVVSVRLAGFPVIGIGGGNISGSGTAPLLHASCPTLADALPILLGD